MIYAARLHCGSPQFVDKFSRKILAEEYRQKRMDVFGETIILIKGPEKKKILRAVEKLKKKQQTTIALDYGGIVHVGEKITFYGRQSLKS